MELAEFVNGSPTGIADPELSEVVATLRPYEFFPRTVLGNDWPPDEGWIAGEDLADAQSLAFHALMARLSTGAFGENRRIGAAALLLRFGWAVGFPVSAYLVCGRAVTIRRFAIRFTSQGMLDAVGVSRLSLSSKKQGDSQTALQARLAAGLTSMSKPVVDALHEWSGFSRHALWSMVISSWAAQFINVGETIKARDRALHEARAVLRSAAVPSSALPRLYPVTVESKTRICQRRAACCLYFKAPGRIFCTSCPILTEEERLAENRKSIVAYAMG